MADMKPVAEGHQNGQIKLDSIESALEDFREGKMVIVVDDEDRENEGDLIVAAEKITPEQVNFMLKTPAGALHPVDASRCRELNLAPQVDVNTSVLGTPFTLTVDKLEGCSTGVSIHDRCATIRALADPASTPATFGRRGISTRFMHRTRVCSAAAGTPRLPLTSHVLPGCSLRLP